MLKLVHERFGEGKIFFWYGGLVATFCVFEAPKYRYEAQALVHPNDNFCRATGRKVALRKLLKALDVPRDTRRRVWEAYWTSGVRTPWKRTKESTAQ